MTPGLIAFAVTVAVFMAVVWGGGFAIASRLRLGSATERLTLGVAAMLTILFVVGFGVHVAGWSRTLWLLIPAGVGAAYA